MPHDDSGWGLANKLVGPVFVNGAPIRFSEKPQRTSLPAEVERQLAQIDADRRRLNEEHATALRERIISGRTATVEQTQERLAELGIRDVFPGMFRPPSAPLPSPEQQRTEDPAMVRRHIEVKAERSGCARASGSTPAS